MDGTRLLPGQKCPGAGLKRCQEMIQESLKHPKVKFMMEHLAKAGCPAGDNFIKAIKCNRPATGYFSPNHGIYLCSNVLRFQDEVTQVIIHELIHAFDECHAKVIWTNCAHHAFSEIRANNLSGDCHLWRELLRGHVKSIRGHGKKCIKRRTMTSLLLNPHCRGGCKDVVEAVWDICYNDTKPFDRAL